MHTATVQTIATTVLSVLICLSTACMTLRPVAADPTGERIRAEIKAGDTVRVLTADGSTHSFQVTTVGMSSLVGNAVKMSNGGTDVVGSRVDLPYRDIQQIDVQSVSGPKTTAIVVGVALAAAIAILIGSAEHPK